MSDVRARALQTLSGVLWLFRLKNRLAVASLYVIIALVILAAGASLFAPYNPSEISNSPLLPPSSHHLFGTDYLGRDVFSQVIFGMRITLLVGFCAGMISLVIGAFAGAYAGYHGGLVDAALMRLTDALMTIPGFLLLIVVAAIYGGSITTEILVIGLTIWPPLARITRAEFLSLKTRQFVEASKLAGASSTHLIWREILPNAAPPIIASTSLRIGSAMFAEASLSFLGLGDPQFLSLGQLMNYAIDYLGVAWWIMIFPGLFLIVTVLAFNLLGNGITDALNPALARVKMR